MIQVSFEMPCWGKMKLFCLFIVSLFYCLVGNSVSGQTGHPGGFHNSFSVPSYSSYFPDQARNWWTVVSNQNSYSFQRPMTFYPEYQHSGRYVRHPELRNTHGWGRADYLPSHQFHSHSPVQSSYGWTTAKIPVNMCMEIIDLNITKPSDIKDGWVIFKAISDEGRKEVDKNDILNPNLILVPPTPRSVLLDQTIPYNISSIIRITADSNGQNLQETMAVTNNTGIQGSIEVSASSTDASADNLEASVILYKVPAFSPPLRGKDDPKQFFRDGLKYSVGNRSAGLTLSPVQDFFREDILFVGDLFRSLIDLNGNKNSQISEGALAEESWVDVESLVGRVEKKFIPEPDHSEQTVLDAEFNFGLPVVYFKFENASELAKTWINKRTAEGRIMERGSLVIKKFGSLQKYRENVDENLRRKMEVYREFGRDTFISTERKVQDAYAYSQYIICQSRDGDGNCGECPLDPISGGETTVLFKPGKVTLDFLNRLIANRVRQN